MEAKDTSTTGRKLRPSTMVIGLGLAGILAFQGYRYLANQGEEKTPLEPIDSIGTLNTGVEDSLTAQQRLDYLEQQNSDLKEKLAQYQNAPQTKSGLLSEMKAELGDKDAVLYRVATFIQDSKAMRVSGKSCTSKVNGMYNMVYRGHFPKEFTAKEERKIKTYLRTFCPELKNYRAGCVKITEDKK
tara:strand:+ start:107368 stop:107925 length:558 start_codon:yes stop_codon:yes gene_type:complete